ncbi:MAG TPA: RES family NAD+ phosphorylase [Actinomycetota bacterium]|nr:RES family NAD+ phosphorylase [Actinomycetota bacterium]
MIAFRHCDSRFPFLWEDAGQLPGRWHDVGEGPVHYLADTPDGAWAEFIRHEEIRDPADLETVTRALWAINVPDEGHHPRPALPRRILVRGPGTYLRCRAEARRLRAEGHGGLLAPSAALLPGSAAGWRVDGGLVRGPRKNGMVLALFGRRPDLIGWPATVAGRPGEDILGRVRYFGN